MFGPIISIIKNTTADTWHPIVFVEDPLPGPHSDDKPIRHKSKMHHTTGFASREEAVASVPELQKKVETVAIGPVKLALGNDFEWDGDGIPAIVHFFSL